MEKKRQTFEVLKKEQKEVVLDIPVVIVGEAKRVGTIARVCVPQEWLGKKVRCMLEDEGDE